MEVDVFLKRIITCDEAWFHHFEPESKYYGIKASIIIEQKKFQNLTLLQVKSGLEGFLLFFPTSDNAGTLSGKIN